MSTRNKPATSNSEPMEFETFVMQNANNERSRLVREAAGMPKAELVERAGTLGIPTAGSKEDIVARVKDTAHTD